MPVDSAISSALTRYGSRQSLADLGVVACEACALVKPAGLCLVAASPLEPVGGVLRVPGLAEDLGQQLLDLVEGERDEAGIGWVLLVRGCRGGAWVSVAIAE
jgi:hypothetical protein